MKSASSTANSGTVDFFPIVVITAFAGLRARTASMALRISSTLKPNSSSTRARNAACLFWASAPLGFASMSCSTVSASAMRSAMSAGSVAPFRIGEDMRDDQMDSIAFTLRASLRNEPRVATWKRRSP